MRRYIITAALCATFSMVFVAAGHGVAPIGIFLLLGFKGWPLPVGSALLSMGLLLSSDLTPRSPLRLLIGFVAVGGMSFAWFLFFSQSEARPLTLISSVPFFTFASWKVVRLFLTIGGKRHGDGPF
jgi:hypothetical protein